MADFKEPMAHEPPRDDAARSYDDNGLNTVPQTTQSHAVSSMRYYAAACASSAIVGVVFMIAQNELAWATNTTAGIGGRFCPDASDITCDPRDAAQMFPIRNEQVTLNILRGVVTATTALSLLFLCLYYHHTLLYRKSRNQLAANASVLTAPSLRWPFLLEFALIAVHVFPGIDDLTPGSPVLYLICTQGMFVRWYLLARVVVYHSSLMGSNGRFISALTHVEFSTGFILKTALKDRPLVSVLTLLLLLVFSASYAVRMIETLVCVADRSLGCMPLSFDNALWLIVVTMMLLGYGDTVAHTTGECRVGCSTLCISGSLV